MDGSLRGLPGREMVAAGRSWASAPNPARASRPSPPVVLVMWAGAGASGVGAGAVRVAGGRRRAPCRVQGSKSRQARGGGRGGAGEEGPGAREGSGAGFGEGGSSTLNTPGALGADRGRERRRAAYEEAKAAEVRERGEEAQAQWMDDFGVAPEDRPGYRYPEGKEPCPCRAGGDPMANAILGRDGSASYAECCGRFVEGGAACPDALSLMRARYSAYAKGRADFVVATTHPDNPDRRTANFEGDVRSFCEGVSFEKLEVHEFVQRDDATAIVTFTAVLRGRKRGTVGGALQERSRFVKDPATGRWLYREALKVTFL